MSKTNDYSNLAQIDYCIQSYYSKYMYGTVKKSYKSIQKVGNKEYGSYMVNHGNAFTPGTAQIVAANNDAVNSHLWDRISTDKMVNRLKSVWGKNAAIQTDAENLAKEFFVSLLKQSNLPLDVNKMSKNQIEKASILASYAERYVRNRFDELLVNQLAQYKVPKSSAEYIMKSSLEDSLVNLMSKGTWLIHIRGGAYEPGKYDTMAEGRGKKLYKATAGEKAVAAAGSMIFDLPFGVGFGSVTKGGINLVSKGVTKVTTGSAKSIIKHGSQAEKLIMNPVSSAGQDWGIRFGLSFPKADSSSPDANLIFGDDQAETKIKKASNYYRKHGTEYISNINSGLHKKIKVACPDFNLQSKLTSNQLMKEAKGYSFSLQKSITKYFDHQAIPYNSKASIPGWMLNKSSKQCRALAASFYAIAKQMSEKRIDEVRVPGGRKMRLKEVAQRAYDYSRAATYIDRKTWERKAEQERRSIPRHRGYGHSHNQSQNVSREQPEEVIMDRVRQTGTSYTTPSSNQDIKQQQPMDSQYQQFQPSINGENLAGWQKGLEDNGLGDFTSLGKNLGYVLAMLPDMLIGMFTGKNPNFKLDDNYMQLGALMMAFFMRKRSPMIALLLGGLGGASLLNNVNKGLQTKEQKEAAKQKQFKRYPDEPLNPRIQDPILKGRSLLCTIDGKPMTVTINNDEPVYCVEKGIIPINTFANRVLQIIDDQKNQSSQNYDRHIGEENQEQQGMQLK